ncbi:putative tat pathway signal sequence [Rosellinia necatrix]|uniref:Putative tat pathway signal sequence n=1 Tax=Rosellinia necatrix TaxID=77044 RepID=A0A1W2TTW5_ROSNE|nr:putative tat pathway signal sequence [Rosellinia necatrix]
MDMESSPKAEASSHGIAKLEPSDGPSVSQIPSRTALSPQPDSREGLDDEEPKETNYLEQLCDENTLEALEAGVSVAAGLLSQLRDTLSTYANAETESWSKTVTELEGRTAPTRTVVGVVGNTGAGKSSVINALLDEERLLPTNCLRACTASPTEISFNHSDDPEELYRAEIEFISSEEWIRELQVLFSDLLDGTGQISRDATKPDTEANIAYAKVKAVYPQKTREMISQADPRTLANEPTVRGILGTTKVLKERTAKRLYNGMQHYVDSKEKSAGSEKNASMEYWPLIKVVRIFTKANALSTGAVVVDLPGVQDSNAARAAVAESYMKSCTGLWIVAPITRAVDDKTAKSLLGDSFKRQLKYDGTYSAVSFICSKTDDISITEAAESLGFEAEVSDSWEEAKKMEKTQKSLQSQVSGLKEDRRALDQRLDECETQIEMWEDMQSEISDGNTVYDPSAGSKKRKRGASPFESRKRLISEIDEERGFSDDDTSDKENSQSEQNLAPLTKEEVEERLLPLRAQKKEMRRQRQSLNSQITELGHKFRTIAEERNAILKDFKAICIQGRNDYSRGAIKQDFAAGIKELDQENAVEEDDETFDPDQDIRDYDEVARSLPVFCVSSRAYQKLSGRLEKDDFESHGFPSVEDTEIPQLQEHAKKLTESGRRSHCRSFLNDLSRLINSMKLWSMHDDSKSSLTLGEKRREAQHLKKLLDQLEEDLASTTKQAINLIRDSLAEQIFENIDNSIPSAIDAAPDTAYSWGRPRAEGGMFWATYKATVRRYGVYSGASGPRDFNSELFQPISRGLATNWERAFQRRLPTVLEGFARDAASHLQQFHQTAKARAEQRYTNPASLLTLSNQILSHIRTIKAIPTTINGTITETQREANREFTPVICHMMTTAYDICTNESGPGSYARMKDAMINHVDVTRHSMFIKAAEVVKELLETMCRAVKRDIDELVQAVFDTVFVDYMRTLGGTEVDRSKKKSREDILLRSHVNRVLINGDMLFAPILNGSAAQGEKMETADDAIQEGAAGLRITTPDDDSRDNKNIVSQADELIQADIRQQGANEDSESDEELIIKKESRS